MAIFKQNISETRVEFEEIDSALAPTSLEAQAIEPLSFAARQALVTLMRDGVILAAQKKSVFELLVQHEGAIRLYLEQLFLQLLLDPREGIAFVQTLAKTPESLVDESTEEVKSLVTKRTLSVYDTLILLVLRKYYQERETAGEHRIIIDTERLESLLTPFLPITNHAKADQRKLNAALKRFVEKKLLLPIRGEDDRYQITVVIRYVVSAEFLDSLLSEYLALTNEGAT